MVQTPAKPLSLEEFLKLSETERLSLKKCKGDGSGRSQTLTLIKNQSRTELGFQPRALFFVRLLQKCQCALATKRCRSARDRAFRQNR
jgi:hypothetical protein